MRDEVVSYEGCHLVAIPENHGGFVGGRCFDGANVGQDSKVGPDIVDDGSQVVQRFRDDGFLLGGAVNQNVPVVVLGQ